MAIKAPYKMILNKTLAIANSIAILVRYLAIPLPFNYKCEQCEREIGATLEENMSNDAVISALPFCDQVSAKSQPSVANEHTV